MLFCKLVEKEFFVEGIHCEKCKGNVEKALKSIEGVKKVVVDLKGNAVIKSKGQVDNLVIKEKIEEAGFSVSFE